MNQKDQFGYINLFKKWAQDILKVGRHLKVLQRENEICSSNIGL